MFARRSHSSLTAGVRPIWIEGHTPNRPLCSPSSSLPAYVPLPLLRRHDTPYQCCLLLPSGPPVVACPAPWRQQLLLHAQLHEPFPLPAPRFSLHRTQTRGQSYDIPGPASVALPRLCHSRSQIHRRRPLPQLHRVQHQIQPLLLHLRLVSAFFGRQRMTFGSAQTRMKIYLIHQWYQARMWTRQYLVEHGGPDQVRS